MIKVILYSTGCPKCSILKKKLAAKNVFYTEVNDVNEMMRLGLKEVPALAIDGQMKDFTAAVKFLDNI